MKILYFGPIAEVGKPAVGGYEAANRKNIDALRKRGIEVVEFRNPSINRNLGTFGKLAYLKLFLLPFFLIQYVEKKDVIMHTTPLYGNLLEPSLFTIWMAKKLGIPTLVDVRAGSLTHYYQTRSNGFKKKLQRMLEWGTMLTVEGSRYISDIKNILHVDKPCHYFPNIADCSSIVYHKRNLEKINIFYFGRITSAKGMDIIIETIKKMDDRFMLYLAGDIAGDIDKESLKSDRIKYLGFLTPIELKQQMKMMHIFVFPTKHVGEGQSNSLIEAMSEGLIPVVSEQGFNAEVVADCGVVLPQGSNADDYKTAIEKLAEGSLDEMSKKCQNHIKECHNIDVEIPKLIKLYNELICTQ